MAMRYYFLLACVTLAGQISLAAQGNEPPALPAVLATEFLYDKASFPSCHASTITETKSGLVASFFGGSAEGKPDVGIWVCLNAGKAWSAPVEVATGIQPDGKRLPCWNPVLFALKEGVLSLFYKVGPSPAAWWGMLITSADDGKTWSKPVRLPDGILGPIKNKPVAMADGILLCPSSSEDQGWRVHMEFASRGKDGGWTFEKTPALCDGKTFGLIQPTLIHHGEKWIALCRSRGLGKIVSLESADSGKTWSDPQAMELPNPNSGIDAVTLADGRSLLVYNHTAKGRSPLNIALSADGKTWAPSVILEDEKGEFSYPAAIQTSDGLVHVTYTWNRKKVKHVTLDPKQLK